MPQEDEFDPGIAAIGCALGCGQLLLRGTMLAIVLGGLAITIALVVACFQVVV